MEFNGQLSKQLKPLTYPRHICGLNRHKLTICPKFNEMQTINNHMIVIQVQIENNIIEDVLLDYVLNVNIMTK
jgi:hypothetical protein